MVTYIMDNPVTAQIYNLLNHIAHYSKPLLIKAEQYYYIFAV